MYASRDCLGVKELTGRSGYIDRGTKEEGEECDDDHMSLSLNRFVLFKT